MKKWRLLVKYCYNTDDQTENENSNISRRLLYCKSFYLFQSSDETKCCLWSTVLDLGSQPLSYGK